MPTLSGNAEQLENYVRAVERRHTIKPDNEARIVWFDSAKRKTPYAILYLHGFRASQMEGYPIHTRIAKEFGCNLYLNRIPEHGIDTTDALIDFTADKIWANAKESLAVAKEIGDKVIIISTSTGGTAAIYLASVFPNDIYALVNMSPNIEINNSTAFLLNNHWGLPLARLVNGSDYVKFEEDSVTSKFWTPEIRLESLAHLEEFVEATMTEETFSKVSTPALTLYYYKNESEQDPVLKVDAMLRMHEQLSTPDSMKVAAAVPTSGAHCMGSELTSKDIEAVYHHIENFLTQTLGLKKVAR